VVRLPQQVPDGQIRPLLLLRGGAASRLHLLVLRSDAPAFFARRASCSPLGEPRNAVILRISWTIALPSGRPQIGRLSRRRSERSGVTPYRREQGAKVVPENDVDA
jgi:hypothetical protein